MDFERVAYFSQKAADLERAKEAAEPLKQAEHDEGAEWMRNLAERITSLPGYVAYPGMQTFGQAYYYEGRWTHTFEPDDTHERPLQLIIKVEYKHKDDESIPELRSVAAAWFDNLNTDDMTRKPISKEVVYVSDLPSEPPFDKLYEALDIQDIDSTEMHRRLGLLHESVVEAEKVALSS